MRGGIFHDKRISHQHHKSFWKYLDVIAKHNAIQIGVHAEIMVFCAQTVVGNAEALVVKIHLQLL